MPQGSDLSISGLHSRLPRGVRPRLEGKPRTPLSSRVATRVSWSPLSGLKGAFTHRVAFEEGSGPRVLLKSGPGRVSLEGLAFIHSLLIILLVFIQFFLDSGLKTRQAEEL